MSDTEKKILKMYDGSMPDENTLFEKSWVNHIAWTITVAMCGVALWLAIALINAENQRHALMNKQCADPVFKGEIDAVCMQTVNSREHWYEHLWYGMTHLRRGGN